MKQIDKNQLLNIRGNDIFPHDDDLAEYLESELLNLAQYNGPIFSDDIFDVCSDTVCYGLDDPSPHHVRAVFLSLMEML